MDLSRHIDRSAAPWWLPGAVLVIASTMLGQWLGTEKWYVCLILFASLMTASYIASYYSKAHKFLAGFSYLPLFILIWVLGDYINAGFWEVDKHDILILLLSLPMLLGATLGWGVSKHKHTVGMYVKSRPWEFGLVFCFIVLSINNLYVLGWLVFTASAQGFNFEASIALASLVVSIVASCIAVYYSDSAMRKLLGWTYVILLPVVAVVAILTAVLTLDVALYLVTGDGELSNMRFFISLSLTIGLTALGCLRQRRLLQIAGIMLTLTICASVFTATSHEEGAGLVLYLLSWYSIIVCAGAIIGIVLGYLGHLRRSLLQKR